MGVHDDETKYDAREPDGALRHGGVKTQNVGGGPRDGDVIARGEGGEHYYEVRELHGAEETLEGGCHGHESHHVKCEVKHAAVEKHRREHSVDLTSGEESLAHHHITKYQYIYVGGGDTADTVLYEYSDLYDEGGAWSI